jgi:biotin-(acetyl-CoA carboxylase) ligase
LASSQWLWAKKARGIDSHGALLVETPAGVRRFISGEVTVRIDT